MDRVCPRCKEKRGELAFGRYIDGHVIPTRECVHCIAADAREFHRNQKRKVGRRRKNACR